MGKTLGYGEITVANVTEPFTVMLTNEAQQFATDSNRKVTSAQSYYTDIIVIRGSQERTDYTIGNITSGSGITVSKSSKRVTFSVSAGTTIGADTGVIEIPITLDGQTVKKQFSWSCGKQGPQGVQGNDGNSFAWNMLSETNCGKKHWGTESSGGKYSVEDFITEDNINAVKLICTEGISTSNWSYVLFKDIKMLKQLKPSTKYTLSYDIKANRSGAISHSICKGDVSNFCTNTVVVNNIIGNETWQHISVVLTTNDLKTTPTNEILYLGRNALSKVGYSIIKNLKLVEGDIDTPWSPSQSDIEGRGVAETVQYYLAASQASGVTSSTSGWSTDITTQKLTADKKYLWNCYQTKYSDGTSEPISTPKVIGVYGDKGQNAKNLSITPSSQYFKSTDGGKTFAPNTITIKPTIQGEISFGKWQYSIDGGVSFADVVSGQKGLTVSNNVLTVSKDSSLYSDAVTMITFRAVASDSSFYDTCSIAKIYDVSDIGDGRNLLTGVSSYTKDTPFEKTDSRADGWTMYQNIITSIELEAGKKYVLQAKTDGNWAANHDINGQDPSKKLVTLWLCSDKTNNCFDMRQGYAVFTPTVTAKYKLRVNQYSNGTDAYTIHLWDIKLEKGSSPTGWTPAPEDVQTAILSTKSEIADVSLKVDKNKQAIEQRVEKTTYQQDLNLVKGDINKANEGLNKWRYEIYPKSLFASEYQGKSTMDVFAKNTNLTPSQSMLINDTDFGKSWAYGDNYIGYALTFVKFSAAKSVAITFKHDDGAHLYLNGKLIGGDDTCNTGSGESLTLSFIQGWNCLEVVLNEKSGGEYIGLGTTISAISECQLMNCYYGTPIARQSHITNQLVQNTTDIDGVSGSVQKVMSTVGGSGKIDEFVSNYATWKKKVDGIETRVGETYTTKDDFDDLQIGGRNLLKHSSMIGEKLICDNYFICNNCNIQEYTNDGFHIITPTEGNANNGIAFAFDNFTIMEINGGDTITFSCDIKGTSDSHAPFVSIHISDNNWYGSGVVQKNTDVSITKDWQRVSVTITTPTGLTKNHMWLAIHGNHQSDLYVRNFKLEKGNKPTDWTPAPEDVNGKIVNVETIANQTANKFQWIVKGGDSSSNFTLTDRVADLVAERINFNGLVKFSGLNTDAKNEIGKVAQSKVDGLNVGGRNLALQSKDFTSGEQYWSINSNFTRSVDSDGFTVLSIKRSGAGLEWNRAIPHNYIPVEEMHRGIIVSFDFMCDKVSELDRGCICALQIFNSGGGRIGWYESQDILSGAQCKLSAPLSDGKWIRVQIPFSEGNLKTTYGNSDAVAYTSVSFNLVANGSIHFKKIKIEYGNKATDWTPAPEDYLPQANLVSNWTTNTTWIDGGKIYTGSITADKIATDAIKSRNYISSGCTQGSFLNLSDGSFTSPNLSWDSNGNLIAKNANLSGEITATNGSIAGWTIISNKMYTTGSGKYTGIGKYGSAYAFWAGATSNDNGNSAVFKVGHTGKLTATDADITGTITATNGKIGRYDITSTYLMTNSGSNASGIGGNQAFWAGAEDSNSAPFRVGYDGVLWAENAAIRGSIETGNLGDEGDTVSIINGHIGIQGTSNNVEIYSTGFKFGIDGDYYLMSVSEGVKCYRNLYATDFVADGWLYCSEVHSSGAVVIGADSESFYWAHGYQIARGTSWGGVCVGDDSQQLRLYGSSIWASHSISTSDENLKENFTTLDQYENFYMNLNPIGFNYIGDYDGKKTHFGFGAHKTEDVLESEGYDADKFAVVTHRPLVQEDIEKRFGKDVEVDIETEYGVSYTEFIALNTHMIQKTRRELTKVKQEKADLEVRLQAIEAKLGL